MLIGYRSGMHRADQLAQESEALNNQTRNMLRTIESIRNAPAEDNADES